MNTNARNVTEINKQKNDSELADAFEYQEF